MRNCGPASPSSATVRSTKTQAVLVPPPSTPRIFSPGFTIPIVGQAFRPPRELFLAGGERKVRPPSGELFLAGGKGNASPTMAVLFFNRGLRLWQYFLPKSVTVIDRHYNRLYHTSWQKPRLRRASESKSCAAKSKSTTAIIMKKLRR